MVFTAGNYVALLTHLVGINTWLEVSTATTSSAL